MELTDHGDPCDGDRNDALAELAERAGLRLVATNNVHYADPSGRRLATALAAVRARRSLDEIDGWLPAAATAHLRSGDEMARRFAAYPGAVANAAAIAARARLRPAAGGAEAARLPDPRAGPHRDVLAAQAHLRRRADALRHPRRAPGRVRRSSTTSWT